MGQILHFPTGLLRETQLTWQLSGRTISSGQTGAGFEPMAETTVGGLWRAELGSIPVRTKPQVHAWRALEALLDSGATTIILPMCDKRYFPVPVVGGAPLYSYGTVSLDDGTLFDDGTGIEQPVVVAFLAQDAGLRATSVRLLFLQGAPLQGGEHFSIRHGNLGDRLYRIAQVKIDPVTGYSDVTIRPPLREATPAFTPLDFDAPKCVMRIANAESMKLSLQLRKWGSPTATFVESFDYSAVLIQGTPPVAPTIAPTLDFSQPGNSQFVPGI
ncbi:hypothetical protein [Bradyrhizobium sp. SRS-191]|uniref:hypothetical protein n=1 Tax=Bradyrhizobium sp. SRS-191 TaxID=2962606 RepID=UPI00211EB8E3|nr:hypothetical protein [Bradyrhizobium sp. SRS-191]